MGLHISAGANTAVGGFKQSLRINGSPITFAAREEGSRRREHELQRVPETRQRQRVSGHRLQTAEAFPETRDRKHDSDTICIGDFYREMADTHLRVVQGRF